MNLCFFLSNPELVFQDEFLVSLFLLSNPINLIVDTVNGFSFHPYLKFVVTSSGHRRFGMQDEFEDELNLGGASSLQTIAPLLQ